MDKINLKIAKKHTIRKTSGLPNDVRTKGRQILNDILSTHLDSDRILRLEDSIHQATIHFLEQEGLTDVNMSDHRAQRTYDQFLRKVCLHLDPNSPIQNDYLLNTINSGDIDIEKVATMSPIFMHPVAWAKQYEAQQLEAQHVAEGVKKAAGTIITCQKCKANGQEYKNVVYEEVQTRSADEAQTIIAHCNNCGEKWKS